MTKKKFLLKNKILMYKAFKIILVLMKGFEPLRHKDTRT